MLAEELFHLLEKEASWRVECTFIEIYNERVRACLFPCCAHLWAQRCGAVCKWRPLLLRRALTQPLTRYGTC